MRKSILILMAAMPVGAAAQEAEERTAIETVIADQLADFVERDVPGAWEDASPLIQGMFGTPENFGAMVENGYPMVWDNSEARFMELREEAGALRQKVMVEDPEGRLWVLDYEMVELPEGWKINGVQVLPAPDLAV
jgi:hypothetical protein